jgi:hypothetical protein
LNSCCPGSTTGRSFAVPPLTPPNSQHNSPKLFLLREALHYFFTQVLDFTYSYKTTILYISMRTYRYHPNSYSLKILPITPYYSKILMPTSLQLHCFHRPGGRGYRIELSDFDSAPKRLLWRLLLIGWHLWSHALWLIHARAGLAESALLPLTARGQNGNTRRLLVRLNGNTL